MISIYQYYLIIIGIDNISKAKKKKKTKNRKRMGKLGNIAKSSEDNLEVNLYFLSSLILK